MADNHDMILSRCKDAEISVIGSMLIQDACIGPVLSTISEDDFLSSPCRSVFRTVKALFLDHRPVDPVTVNHALGGDYAEYLTQVIDLTPTAANVESYCEILKETSRLVRLRELGIQLSGVLDLDAGRDLTSQINAVMVAQSGIRHVTALELAEEFFRRMESEDKPQYIPVGFQALDEKLFIEPGDVIGVGAAPSTGKTAFALQWAVTQAARRKVGFYSLETSAKKATDRIFSREAEVSLGDIKTRILPDDVWARIGEACSRVSTLKLEFIPAQGMTAADIMADAAGRQYDMIFVDYLQLVSGSRRISDRYDIVTESSMTFHLSAQRLGITVVLLSQLSRPQKDKSGKFVPPDMHSFRESGQIEQDLDVALLMWLTDPDDYRSDRRLKIGKNKEGEKGVIDLTFDGKTQSFKPSTAGSYNKIRAMGAAARREMAQQKAEADYAAAEAAGKAMDEAQQAFEEVCAVGG